MFRYASINRPLWIGFDVGIPFTIVEKRKSDEINGRMPHDVIETEVRISSEKIYSLELVDYEEVEAKRILYDYAKTKFSGRSLELVQDAIHRKAIKTTEKIDYYYKKLINKI